MEAAWTLIARRRRGGYMLGVEYWSDKLELI